MKTNLELQKDVQEELKWELSFIDSEIKISVKEGIVTLTGIVDCLLKKQVVTDAVRQVAGVKVVINNLELKERELANISESTIGDFENTHSNKENSIKTSGA